MFMEGYNFMIHLQNILPVIIYAILLAIHYFLSRTGNKILGLIVPVGVIASLIYVSSRYYTYETDWRYYYRYCGSIILGRGVA